MSDIVLTASQRSTLQALQNVTTLQNRTQTRLNTGKKVNSASDDAVAFFKAQGLSQRASDFTTYKSNIDQSVQTINAALSATSSIETILNQLKGVLANVSGNTGSQNLSANTQFKDLTSQIYQIVSDATYEGTNILNSTLNTLSTKVSDRTASTVVLNGYNLQSNGDDQRAVHAVLRGVQFDRLAQLLEPHYRQGTGESTITSFTQLGTGTTLSATQVQDVINNTQQVLDNAIAQIEGITAALGTNVNLLSDRSNFSANYTDVLQTGSDKLTLADLNTEAANSQALSLRQQLGIQSLTTAATQNSAILTLLRGS